jgi:hypothetical protein
MTQEQAKHLKLVDSIALLLVTDEKSDAAAVSFYQTSMSINFYYAKNRPCTTTEVQYIESLLDIVRSYHPSKRYQCNNLFLTKVVSMCIRKIHRRIEKVALELINYNVIASTLDSNNLGDLQFRQPSVNTTRTLSMAIAKAFSVSKSTPEGQQFNGPPNEKILRDYFRLVLTMNETKDLHTRIKDVSGLIMLSYAIGIIVLPFLES